MTDTMVVLEGEVALYQEAAVGITGGRNSRGVDPIQDPGVQQCVAPCFILCCVVGCGLLQVDIKSVRGGVVYISFTEIEQTLRI